LKLFISHSSHDKWAARQISRILEDDGHTTFLDEKDIKSGESIDESIQKHLKESDHLVLLLSPISISSQWVFMELGGARALGKRIVPILFHVSVNEVPHAFSQLLARDINDFDKYRQELREPQKRLKGKARKKPKSPAVTRMVTGTFSGLSTGDTVRIVEVERLTEDDKAKSPKWVSGMDKYVSPESAVADPDRRVAVALPEFPPPCPSPRPGVRRGKRS
jgi:hypothetical protein